MKITVVLNTYKFLKGIPGNMWIGKHRFVPPVTRKDRFNAVKQMMFEEEVMMYLSNPYLTEEQENGYLEEVKRQQEILEAGKPKEFQTPLKNKLMHDHLSSLNLGRTWE